MTATPLAPTFVRSFLDAVVRCLRSTIGVEAVLAVVSERSRTAPTIAVALDIIGDIRGPVTWVFPPEIALELVRQLMDDPDPPAESAADGATELANILTGQATAVLEAHGFRFELGVPRLHVGALPTGVNVRMETAVGPIDLILSLSTDRAA